MVLSYCSKLLQKIFTTI